MKQITPEIRSLIDLALTTGATRAAAIQTKDICVEQKLAALCRTPKCRNYGLSKSCPPHIHGPEWLEHYLRDKEYAVVFRIDLEASILFSDQRPEIMRLLHEIAARVEEKAIAMGFCKAKAFAGGSCKDIFCPEHLNCNAVSGDGVCRHPRIARPSMSGYGINVSKLIKAAGWPSDVNSDTNSGINSDIGGGTDPHDPKAMSWVAGLIVIS